MNFADLELSRRLEGAEAAAGVGFVEARRHADPALGAEWIEVAGARAMFDGVNSPVTQTFGLGLFAEPSVDDLNRLEMFYSERGADTFHEVSPLAGVQVYGILSARRYRPAEPSADETAPDRSDLRAPRAAAVRSAWPSPGWPRR